MSRKKQPVEGVTGLLRDKGSKFIAYVIPIQEVEEVAPFIDKLRNEHPSARHWCFAYRLGEAGEIHRFSDDGEPAGSAGRPILHAMDSADLTNTLAVVVRYFGGTLLGVRGLIDAYGGAVTEALKHASLMQVPRLRRIEASCRFDHLSALQKVMNELQLKPHETIYENEGIRFVFLADEAVINPLRERLTGLFGVNLR